MIFFFFLFRFGFVFLFFIRGCWFLNKSMFFTSSPLVFIGMYANNILLCLSFSLALALAPCECILYAHLFPSGPDDEGLVFSIVFRFRFVYNAMRTKNEVEFNFAECACFIFCFSFLFFFILCSRFHFIVWIAILYSLKLHLQRIHSRFVIPEMKH